jgi:hypothetical protein
MRLSRHSWGELFPIMLVRTCNMIVPAYMSMSSYGGRCVHMEINIILRRIACSDNSQSAHHKEEHHSAVSTGLYERQSVIGQKNCSCCTRIDDLIRRRSILSRSPPRQLGRFWHISGSMAIRIPMASSCLCQKPYPQRSNTMDIYRIIRFACQDWVIMDCSFARLIVMLVVRESA